MAAILVRERLGELRLSFPVMLFVVLLPSAMHSTVPALADAEIRDAVTQDARSLPLPTSTAPVAGAADPLPTIEAPATASSAAMDGTTAGVTTQVAPEDILVQARRHDAGDPLRALNEKSFEATQAVDRAVIAPVAFAYERHVPGPVRDGLRNVLKNLREPIVFVNFLLQLKPGKAAETAGRFTLNTIAGVGGLLDMAKRRPFNLPRRPNGFADTLGFYGVKPGPFFFLPLVGPTTLRDAIGGIADRALLLAAVGAPFNRPAYTVPATILGTLDRRIEFDEDLKRIRDDSANPYLSRRTFYLCRRQAEIDVLKGHRTNSGGTRNQFGLHDELVPSPGPPLRCNAIPKLVRP